MKIQNIVLSVITLFSTSTWAREKDMFPKSDNYGFQFFNRNGGVVETVGGGATLVYGLGTPSADDGAVTKALRKLSGSTDRALLKELKEAAELSDHTHFNNILKREGLESLEKVALKSSQLSQGIADIDYRKFFIDNMKAAGKTEAHAIHAYETAARTGTLPLPKDNPAYRLFVEESLVKQGWKQKQAVDLVEKLAKKGFLKRLGFVGTLVLVGIDGIERSALSAMGRDAGFSPVLTQMKTGFKAALGQSEESIFEEEAESSTSSSSKHGR